MCQKSSIRADVPYLKLAGTQITIKRCNRIVNIYLSGKLSLGLDRRAPGSLTIVPILLV